MTVEHCIKGTRGWEICDEIINSFNVSKFKIIEKETFGSLELSNYLKDINEDLEIELVGLVS